MIQTNHTAPGNDRVMQPPTVLADGEWPSLTADLSHPEKFVVWSFRRWLLGLVDNSARHWMFVWHEFETQMGDVDGKAALANFAKLARCLQLHARRPVQCHHPCCPFLGTDDAWVVSLVAACQVRDRRLADSLVRTMIADKGCEIMLEAAARLAYLMQRHALHLPPRSANSITGTGRYVEPGEERVLH